MEIAVSIVAAVIALGSCMVAIRALRHSRESADAARVSANEAKRANDQQAEALLEAKRATKLQAESIQERKQAKLKLRDEVMADIHDDELRFRIPAVNMGFVSAHNVRCEVTIYDEFRNANHKAYFSSPIPVIAPDESRDIQVRVTPTEFRHFTGKAIIQLIYDDLNRENVIVGREAYLNGRHEIDSYTIRYT